MLRALVAERMDPVLFGYSYDYVGDLAETVSLVWRTARRAPSDPRPPTLGEVVERHLQAMAAAPRRRAAGPRALARLLDARHRRRVSRIIKLVTGGLRIGVSARLAKQALADFGKVDVGEIEELWHGLTPPYRPSCSPGWTASGAESRAIAAAALFRPVMLANPVEDRDLDGSTRPTLPPNGSGTASACRSSPRRRRRLYSRTGDDISASLPGPRGSDELRRRARRRAAGRAAAGMDRHLLRPAAAAEPQDRVAEDARSYPAFVRAYDLLQLGEEDLRAAALRRAPRKRLEAWIAAARPGALRPLAAGIAFADWATRSPTCAPSRRIRSSRASC